MALTLRIVTPTRVVVDTEVSEVTAPGAAGELGFLPEHVTFLGELDVGILRYQERGAGKSVVVHGGYAEVVNDVVTVLADDAELPSEIDGSAARTALSQIDAALTKATDDPAEVDRLLLEHKRAQVRIDACR